MGKLRADGLSYQRHRIRLRYAAAQQQHVECGGRYAGLEKLRALRDAARTKGELAGAGLLLGAGAEPGRVFASQQAALPEPPTAEPGPVQQLQKLKLLHRGLHHAGGV